MHASLTLGPPGSAGAARMTPTQLERLAGHPHVWLVVNGPVTSSVRQTIVPELNTAFRPAALYDFVGATLLRFDARQTSQP